MNELIVDTLISKLRDSKFGMPDAEGEWNWINENHRREFLESIYSRNWTLLHYLLMDPLNAKVAYGIMTPIDSLNENILFNNDFNADLSLFTKLYGEKSLEVLEHSECLKHPWSGQTDAYLTYPDSPRHAHFAYQILEIAPPAMIGVEIGGGYGGMIYFLKKFGFKEKIVDCDLLEALLIAYVFLSFNKIRVELCFTREHLLEAFGGDAEVILIIPSLFKVLQELGDVGFTFNSRSLSEMSETQSSEYLETLNTKISSRYIISENAEELLFPNSIRHIEKVQDELATHLSDYKLIEKKRTNFMGGANRYTTRVYADLQGK
jgi:hypothetical protein